MSHSASETFDTPDPLSKLHKMSTTAGVASQQYVAVNGAAVVAALLGLASALTIFSPLLLVIPIAGLIVGIFAWRQISASNGTETGKLVAALGLTLSLLIGGGVAGKELLDNAHARADGRQMDAIAHQLADHLKAGRAKEAYELFDDKFRERIQPAQFVAVLRNTVARNGQIQSIAWNQVPPHTEWVQGGNMLVAEAIMSIRFDAGEGRFTFIFRKVGDNWQILNISEMFPPERPPKNGQ